MKKKPYENLLKSFGELVASRRKEMGLSQEELAVNCGVHRTYISDIENGKRNFTLKICLLLARGLKMNPAELIGFAVEKEKVE